MKSKEMEPQMKAPRVAPLEGASAYAPAGAYVSMHYGGHDAYERRLNALSEQILGAAFDFSKPLNQSILLYEVNMVLKVC